MMTDDAPSLGYRVERMYAYLAVGTDGEGVIAGPLSPGAPMMPLVGADEARMRLLRPFAEEIATLSGRQVRLVRFDTRVEVETIDP